MLGGRQGGRTRGAAERLMRQEPSEHQLSTASASVACVEQLMYMQCGMSCVRLGWWLLWKHSKYF